ncbi:MAG: deoxyribodipyrimidine photo-lyase [Gammaproteobacteria bacterium]|jgi:deoxyribodipyrimidine photo-lyase
MRGLVWLRADLRINDNSALFHASRECRDGLIALHCIPSNLTQAHFNQRQYTLLQQQLTALQQDLAKLNIPLLIKTVENTDDIETVILDLMQTHQLETLYYNNRYELAQRTQDKHINALLEKNQLTVKHYTDHLIAPPEKLLTPKDKPFTSLIAFKKTWQSFLRHAQIHPLGAVEKQTVALQIDSASAHLPWQAQVDAPWSLKESLAQILLAPEHTDQLNTLFTYLTVGLVSPRQFIHTLLQAENVQHKHEVDKWLNLLIEREFDHHIMFHFPHICDQRDFMPNMHTLPWQKEEQLLQAWQNGQTGYPLIDASMRCLNQTGYLPDELLQASALFFTKVLFMDYRLGEAHFANTRIDYEFATNNALWQWSASTGAESVIYSRIPQPSRQSEVFDATGEFIRQYCPELASINAIGIHDPHYHARDVVTAQGYPDPIVDYNTMRKKTIYHFKSLNKSLKSSDFVAETI